MKTIKLGLDRNKSYLLGLSGGADSVCLFHLLREGGYSFSVAHINHCIRGDEADRDERFCRDLAENEGIPFFLLRQDVPALARESGESLEEAARRVRYSFFEKTMRRENIPVLLTAHNADDNAETLLLMLARGSSPAGACGIPPVRVLPFGEVQRPLLAYSKEEITSFCRERSLEFMTDSTNADTSYARNRVRMNILPELRAINPHVLSALARFTELQRAEREYIDSEAEKYTDLLECEALASIPTPIAARALALAAFRSGAMPETLHVDGMLELARKNGGSLSLPGGIIACADGGRITFRSEKRTPNVRQQIYPDYEHIELKEGENAVGGAIISVFRGELTNDFAQVYNLSTSACINLDRIKETFYARPRREGDRILIRGMHRSVKKLISEKASALSLTERRALPVICCGEDIVWVPCLEVADAYRGTGAPTVYYRSEVKNDSDTE